MSSKTNEEDGDAENNGHSGTDFGSETADLEGNDTEGSLKSECRMVEAICACLLFVRHRFAYMH